MAQPDSADRTRAVAGLLGFAACACVGLVIFMSSLFLEMEPRARVALCAFGVLISMAAVMCACVALEKLTDRDSFLTFWLCALMLGVGVVAFLVGLLATGFTRYFLFACSLVLLVVGASVFCRAVGEFLKESARAKAAQLSRTHSQLDSSQRWTLIVGIASPLITATATVISALVQRGS